MTNGIENVIRCAQQCMDQELSNAQTQDVKRLLRGRTVDRVGIEGFDDDEFNFSDVDGTANIQFHDVYEGRFGNFLEALAMLGYTYTVHSAFEVPPIVKVTNRSQEPVQPVVGEEMVEDVATALDLQPEVSEQVAQDAIQLILTRAREFPREGMDVDAEFIVTHALEDAGVGREERLAIVDDVFR